MKNKIIIILTLIIALSLGLAIAGCNDSGSASNNKTTEPVITYTEISTAAELQALENQSGNYKLTKDINIGSSEWTPIDGFSGLLEGASHEIKGLTISGNNENVGLFSTLKGTVKNLKLTSVDITATGDAGTAGALCGTSEGTISNVTVSGTIYTPYYSYVGGICGKVNSGTMDDCTNNSSVTAYDYVGGLVGYLFMSNGSTSNKNTNNGVISGKNYVGGIAGQLQCGSPGSSDGSAYFTNNENTKSVSGSGNYVGGLIGYQSSNYYSYYGYHYTYLTVSNCVNRGNVTGSSYAGGILGYGVYCITTAVVWESNTNEGTVTGSNSGSLYGYLKT